MDRLYTIIKKSTFCLLFIILLLYAIIEARALLYPLAVSVLFAYLLFPVCRWLENRGWRRIPANLVVILLSICIIASVVYLLSTQVSKLTASLPELKDQAASNVRSINAHISSSIGMSDQKFHRWMQQQVNGSFETGGAYLQTIFSATTSTIVSFGLMPVYVFLLLYYRDKLRAFFFMLLPSGRHLHGEQIIEKISHVTRHYMSGVFVVVIILCIINSAGLYLIGLKFALLLGILSGMCSFIPYFGTLIGAIFPVTMAVFATDSPSYLIKVVIMYVLVLFTEHNILTPNITGENVQINPFVTILGILAGELVWGLPGMFVIIPFLGMLKIVLESFTATQPFAFLIGTNGTEQHALTFEKLKGFFSKRKK